MDCVGSGHWAAVVGRGLRRWNTGVTRCSLRTKDWRAGGQTSTMEQLEQLETSIEGFRESGRARLGQMGWIG